MKGRRRGHQGKPDGNVSGQRLQSEIKLKKGGYSSLRWATNVINKDHSRKGLVVPGRRNKNVQRQVSCMVQISAMNLVFCFLPTESPDSNRLVVRFDCWHISNCAISQNLPTSGDQIPEKDSKAINAIRWCEKPSCSEERVRRVGPASAVIEWHHLSSFYFSIKLASFRCNFSLIPLPTKSARAAWQLFPMARQQQQQTRPQQRCW